MAESHHFEIFSDGEGTVVCIEGGKIAVTCDDATYSLSIPVYNWIQGLEQKMIKYSNLPNHD